MLNELENGLHQMAMAIYKEKSLSMGETEAKEATINSLLKEIQCYTYSEDSDVAMRLKRLLLNPLLAIMEQLMIQLNKECRTNPNAYDTLQAMLIVREYIKNAEAYQFE